MKLRSTTAWLFAAALACATAACGSSDRNVRLLGETVDVPARTFQASVPRPYAEVYDSIQAGMTAQGLRLLETDMARGRIIFSLSGADPQAAIACTRGDGSPDRFLSDALARGARLNGQVLVKLTAEGPAATTVVTAADYLFAVPGAEAGAEPTVFSFPSGGGALRAIGTGESAVTIRCAGLDAVEKAVLAAAGT